MTFTVADLLDQLPATGSLSLTKLEKALGLTSKSGRQQLATALQALERLGLVAQEGKEVEKREDDRFIPARLRCSSKGFCFALREDEGDDIYIRDQHLNHAWNGDRVLVTIHRDGGRRRSPEGIVQCILERQCGSVLAQGQRRGEDAVAVPLDDRLLTTIALDGSDDSVPAAPDPDGSADGAVLEVRVDRYPIGQHPARGHVVRRLNPEEGSAADSALLLAKHNLHQRPDPPRSSLRTPLEKEREDLTHQAPLLMEEWQGTDAPALPAVWLEREGELTRLWVHAPSLAERTGFGGALDQWMRRFGESLCLGEQWKTLAPAAMASAALFTPGESQLALSVCLEIDENGDLLAHRFCRSLIRPAAAVTPAILDTLRARKPGSRAVPAALKPIKAQLDLLLELLALSERLRQRRLAAGSVDLCLAAAGIDSLGDLRHPFPDGSHQGWMPGDGQRGPLAVLAELVQPAHVALGRHLRDLGLPALYAVQGPPQDNDLNDVAKAAIALDLPVELDDDGNAPDVSSLAAIFRQSDRARVLQQQLAGVLPAVQLSATPGEHRLAGEAEAYAPWCAAGLHYADLFNQHVLATLLSDGKDRPSVRHKTRVDLGLSSSPAAIDWPVLTPSLLTPLQQAVQTSLIPRLNARTRQSAELSRDLIQMAQARQAEPMVGTSQPGFISGIQSYGFFVEIPPSQCEGLVHVSSLKDDWYEYRSRQSRLVGRKNRRTYKLGDPVEVTVEKVDVLRNQIDLSVPGLPEEESADLEPEHGESAPLPVALTDA
ncbi:RNB domain-containing ribonuclease [Synechococcus sp. RSCCF101]|uniref:RNB domain-containing ribonuclease n=1 Tax=Synechococcus sp. RSCCF101 TaxID=2511069 RepID=UPI001246E860|nr:RNB domain-containing ribonuclease [Synechococcus sp. RSCCF101]QEY31766.1 RNB domain-containing ribonuclease [Synechococcus sp. RSCCF101]